MVVAGIELRVSRTMIIEADSIARMNRILRGAEPIEQKALGLDFPPALLARTNGAFE